MLDNAILGLDMAKATFAAALVPASLPLSPARERPRVAHFDNTPAGFTRLGQWLQQHAETIDQVCLEATGRYWEAVAHWLVAAGYQVSVVNPAQPKHYAASELQRVKTDPVDAGVIARFCRAQRPALWTPPAPEHQTLQALCRHELAIQRLIRQEKNRQDQPDLDPLVAASLHRLLACLEEELATIQAQIRSHIAAHPSLRQASKLLCSIPGIAETSAARLLAELGDVQRFTNTRQAAAYAGVTPRLRLSGTSVHGKSRFSKCGNAALRQALYFPAVVASRCDPHFKAIYLKFIARGKTKMQALGALMHKLVKVSVAILRSRISYQAQVQPLTT